MNMYRIYTNICMFVCCAESCRERYICLNGGLRIRILWEQCPPRFVFNCKLNKRNINRNRYNWNNNYKRNAMCFLLKCMDNVIITGLKFKFVSEIKIKKHLFIPEDSWYKYCYLKALFDAHISIFLVHYIFN